MVCEIEGLRFEFWSLGAVLGEWMVWRLGYNYVRMIALYGLLFSRYKHREEVGVDISLNRHTQEKAIERVKFDLDYLKADEVKKVPDYLRC